jgi:hypothetical protein
MVIIMEFEINSNLDVQDKSWTPVKLYALCEKTQGVFLIQGRSFDGEVNAPVRSRGFIP